MLHIKTFVLPLASPQIPRRFLTTLEMVAQDHGLVHELTELTKKSKKQRLVQAVNYEVPVDGKTQTIQSWRMREWDYYKVPSPFPTLARGLFTTQDADEHRIVARGYDKFFNIGEVPWTSVRVYLAYYNLCSFLILLISSGVPSRNIRRHHTH